MFIPLVNILGMYAALRVAVWEALGFAYTLPISHTRLALSKISA